MEEEKWIHKAAEGDLDAFNHLVLIHQDRVYTQTYRMLGEDAAAADAAQETMIIAYRKLHTFRGGSLRAWLLRIATNICYDELRRRKRRPVVPLEPLNDDEEEVESPAWLADDSANPEDAAQQKELRSAIGHCLEGLSPEFKAAVLMVDVHGMDYQEASEALGCALGTIKSRLARARNSIRTCLQAFRELIPQRYRLGQESKMSG